MKYDENMKKLTKKLGKPYKQNNDSVWIEVKADKIKEALEAVHEVTERISDISVYDAGRHLEVTYRFFVSGIILNVKTRLPADKPRLPTCTRLFPGALLFEQEQHEMFGVWFNGHPGLGRLLFADSTPDKPLRRKDGLKQLDKAVKPMGRACMLDRSENRMKEAKDAGKK